MGGSSGGCQDESPPPERPDPPPYMAQGPNEMSTSICKSVEASGQTRTEVKPFNLFATANFWPEMASFLPKQKFFFNAAARFRVDFCQT